MKSHTQVAIIGGGISGCSLLYHLTQLGWTDAVLIEKNELTAGSTWHAAGLCTHFALNPTIMNMRAYSVQTYKEFEDVDFHACGAMRVTGRQDRMDEFRYVQDVGRIVGQQFDIIDPGEISELHPLARTEELIGGIYEPNDGHVDPSQATQAFAKRAREAGAEIYRHNPVISIQRNSNDVWVIETRDGSIEADIIVNCAGTWAREIGAMMGIDLPIVPMLHQYLVTEGILEVDALGRELPIFRDPDQSWYSRQERDGMIIGPYEQPAAPWAVDGVPAEFGMDLLPPDLERIENIVAEAMDRIPVLAEAGIRTIVNGPITFTPDGNTLIGPVYGMSDAWLLTGTSMGVMEGGGAGKLLAEWMTSGAAPMDALGIDSRRFGAFAETREYRLEKATECFERQFAIHYPYEELPDARPCISPPSYNQQIDLGAQFGFAYGWERANWFATDAIPAGQVLSWCRTNWFDAVREECRAVQENAGLFELSAFSKFEVAGHDAMGVLDSLGTNKPPLSDGGLCLTYALTPEGGVESEFTITRLNHNKFYLVSAAAARRRDHDLLMAIMPGDERIAKVKDVTEQWGVLALAGPRSRDILAELTTSSLTNDDFPWLSAQEIAVAGVPVLAIRVSYVGELGWELHHRIEDQATLYGVLLRAGEPHGIKPCGVYAMNSLRLEKGYRGWGVDLTTERTPLEAGLHPFVKMEGRGFIGKEATVARSREKLGWRMQLLSVETTDRDVFGVHPVLENDEIVGITSSGGYGHRVGKSLALAYIRTDVPMEAELNISILAGTYPAKILERIPYDPTNARMRT